MLQQAVNIVFYTYKWLLFAVAGTTSVVLVVLTTVTAYTYPILDNLSYNFYARYTYLHVQQDISMQHSITTCIFAEAVFFHSSQTMRKGVLISGNWMLI